MSVHLNENGVACVWSVSLSSWVWSLGTLQEGRASNQSVSAGAG